MSPLQPEDTEADMRDKSGAAWRGLLLRQRLKTALEKPENVGTFLFLPVYRGLSRSYDHMVIVVMVHAVTTMTICSLLLARPLFSLPVTNRVEHRFCRIKPSSGPCFLHLALHKHTYDYMYDNNYDMYNNKYVYRVVRCLI